MRLEIEEAALKKEDDAASVERLGTLREELGELRQSVQSLKARYESERAGIAQLRQLRAELEQAKQQLVVAEREHQLDVAAELRHGKIPQIQQKLVAAESAESPERPADALLARGGRRRRDCSSRQHVDPDPRDAFDQGREAKTARLG